MTPPRAVLFDHDGVLVASEPLHWGAWERLLGEMGLPYNNAEMRRMVGKTAPEILVELLNRHQPGWNPGEFDVVRLARRKNDIYLEALPKSLRAYDGVDAGLRALRARGVRLAVVSNSKQRELRAALDLVGLTQYFDAIVSRDDVSAPKPDPAPYLFAAASVGVPPVECMAVEDSPPGITAALVAGIPAAGVLTNFGAATMNQPVPGRPELRPAWVGAEPLDFFRWLLPQYGDSSGA